MEATSLAERRGFAPSTHICPYHIWQPKGVLQSCTCSPTPAHQVRWEDNLFGSGKGVADRQGTAQPEPSLAHGFFGGLDRKRMAVLCRTSGDALVSALRTARKRAAGRFLRICEIVKSR